MVGVIVPALIASLKVAVTVVVVLTPPLVGVKLVTVGGVVSAAPAVVKEDVIVEARALPARSLTPAAPPTTLAV